MQMQMQTQTTTALPRGLTQKQEINAPVRSTGTAAYRLSRGQRMLCVAAACRRMPPHATARRV